MKITSVTLWKLRIPLQKSYQLSQHYGTLYDTSPVVVKIETDTGITGYGETDPMPLFTGESPESVMALLTHNLAPALIGKDPGNINQIEQLMDRLVTGMPVAKAAINIGCYDILGKSCGLPLHALLGGALYESLPIMGSIGGDTLEMAKEAEAIVERGYSSLMVKVGNDPQKDIEKFKAVRKVVGDNFPLLADANQGWRRDEALTFAKGVRDSDALLFEQPVAAADLEGLAYVRSRGGIPVSADESLSTLSDAKRIADLGGADVFSIKISKNGGIHRAEKIVKLAESRGITCLFNSMIEEGVTQSASLGLALTTPNLFPYGHAFFSPLRLERDISSYSLLIQKSGCVTMPKEPGLGIRVSEEELERYSEERVSLS